MSNYLTNLTAQALNQTEGIQPRFAPRFEPLLGVSESVSNHSFGVEAGHSEPFAGETTETDETELIRSDTVQRPLDTRELQSSRLGSEVPLATLQQRDEVANEPISQPPRQSVYQHPSPLSTPQPLETQPVQRSNPVNSPAGSQPPVTPASFLPSTTAVSSTSRGRQQLHPDQPVFVPSAPATGAVSVRSASEREYQPSSEQHLLPSMVERIPRGRQQSYPDQPVFVPSAPATGAILVRSASEREHHPSPEQHLLPSIVEPTPVRERTSSPHSPDAEPTAFQPTQSLIPATRVARPSGAPTIESTVPASVGFKAIPEPTPTIRVSIGRVEVRAIMPPAPPTPRPKAARRGPALSLDDYLKQRNGGQR